VGRRRDRTRRWDESAALDCGTLLGMSTRSRTGQRVPEIVALVLVALILAPAARGGTVLAYDMPWSPVPLWTPFTLGVGTPAPRAVPSDAAAVALGQLVGAGVAQILILAAILLAAALGPVALLRRHTPVGITGQTVAAVVAIWNPFVAERLAIGQWTILLGYAVLSWLALTALGRGPAAPAMLGVTGCLAAGSLGGANGLVVALPFALAAIAGRGRGAARRLALVCLTGAGLVAVWALPSLVAGVSGDPSGAEAFAPRADVPGPTVVSLIAGGGMWNAAAHFVRGSAPAGLLVTAFAVLALLAGVPLLWRTRLRRLLYAALVAFAAVAASALPGPRGGWDFLVVHLPGGGVLRDSQKLLAPWVLLLALAAGVAVDRLAATRPLSAGDAAARRARAPWLAGIAPVAGIVALLVPVALQPRIAWGLGGWLSAHATPADYRATAAALSAADPGLVGVLPWNQYRRYPWNGGRICLTLAPRIVDQQVLFNDALPTREGWIAGEDPRAAAVTRAIAAGADPVTALRRAGVRYLFVETDLADTASGAASARPPARPPGRVVSTGASGTAYDLGAVAVSGQVPVAAPLVTGWLVTGATWCGLGVAAMVRAMRRNLTTRRNG
jgi:hypothetical protein